MESRPDLVAAGVAPINSEHGFTVPLGQLAVKALLGTGRHVLTVRVLGSPSTVVPRDLPSKSRIVCVDGKCA